MPAGRPKKPIDTLKKNTYRTSSANPTALAVVPMDSGSTPALELPLDEAIATVVEHGATWLSVTDVRLNFLRELLEERNQIRAAVMNNSGDRKALRDIDKSISESLSLLGFDPSARARLGLSEVQKISKLEEIKARRASSRNETE